MVLSTFCDFVQGRVLQLEYIMGYFILCYSSKRSQNSKLFFSDCQNSPRPEPYHFKEKNKVFPGFNIEHV